MELIRLFLQFFKTGAFSFGGGMATLPFVYEMARSTNWITDAEVSNILSVSQVTPGPLTCNIGTVAGWHVAGLMGALVANVAFVLPAICFAGIAFKFIKSVGENKRAAEVAGCIRSASLAVLITSSITLFKMAFMEAGLNDGNGGVCYWINLKSIGLAIFVGLTCIKFKKVKPVYFMICTALVGGLIGV